MSDTGRFSGIVVCLEGAAHSSDIRSDLEDFVKN